MDDIRTTRRTLIQRLKNTDNDEAWQEFYDFYRQLITGWARRFGCSPEKADDVFQETMVCLLRNISSFDYNPGRGSFRSYLKTIVKGRCYDLFRKESRYIAASDNQNKAEQTNSSLDILNTETAEPVTPEDDSIWLCSLVRQALKRVYGKVDQQTYKSFCMYVLEGYPAGEVGKRLGGLRTGTVYQQKSRVLKMLEKEFLLLLAEMGETIINSRNRGLFIKAVEEMINNHPEYRATMINAENNCPDIKFFEMIKPAMKELPANGETGSYLCIINPSFHRWHKLTETVKIGSKNECDLVLNDDNQVSGMHLEICRKNDVFAVSDLNSANGTYLNSRKLLNSTVLCDGDIISLSNDSFLIFNQL